MTTGELWRAVGRLLADARLAKKWKPYDVQKAGGPDMKTVQNQEAGDPKSIASLEAHAEVLGLTIVDVLTAALSQSKKPMSSQAALILRAFEQTSVGGQQALVAMATELLAVAQPKRGRLPDGPH